MINIGSAGVQRYRRQFAERNIRRSSRRVLIGDFDFTDGIDILAILGRKPHRQCELPIAFQYRGRLGAAHRRLNDGIHVAGIKAVAGSLGAIYRDIEIRLA